MALFCLPSGNFCMTARASAAVSGENWKGGASAVDGWLMYGVDVFMWGFVDLWICLFV
jgi:hypothetical protein